MWFKNIRVYRFTSEIDLAESSVLEALEPHAFVPCTSLDYFRYGWVPPLGALGTMLTHTVSGYIMLCARKQEKILPAAAINEIVEERVFTVEGEQARKVSRKERTGMREDVVMSLLPRALTRSKRVFGYLDTRNQLLVIDAASANAAEEFMDALREALGELPVVPLTCQRDPGDVLTSWIEQGRAPRGLMFDGEAELQNERDVRNVVRVRNQELEADEIASHLKAGKRVTQLALVWREAIRFVIDQDLALKRVRFEDQVQEQAEGADDEISQFDQDFAIMTIQLAQLLGELVEHMGGVQRGI